MIAILKTAVELSPTRPRSCVVERRLSDNAIKRKFPIRGIPRFKKEAATRKKFRTRSTSLFQFCIILWCRWLLTPASTVFIYKQHCQQRTAVASYRIRSLKHRKSFYFSFYERDSNYLHVTCSANIVAFN